MAWLYNAYFMIGTLKYLQLYVKIGRPNYTHFSQNKAVTLFS